MGFFLVGVCGLRGVQAPECAGSVVVVRGLSSRGTWAPELVGSVVAAHGLSCPTHVGS